MSKISTKSRVIPGIIDDIDILSIIKSPRLVRDDDLEDIEVLGSSIKQNGLFQPILVRAKQEHLYEIVAGNRRYQACKALGWKRIACHIVELNDKEAFEISLTENIQRKTLNALEEAHAFKSYISDFGWGGVCDLALRIGKSPSYITKRIKLLNLPSNILESIESHRIGTSVAEELCSIKYKDKQSVLANLISSRRLSMRMTRKLSRDLNGRDMDCLQYATHRTESTEHIRLAERSFDKSIAAIRIAMNSLVEVINSVEDDWIVYEVLMQHKNMLHTQIDILLKEKKNLGSLTKYR
jgi:ParB family transcriptional regulator, chromosome partitioning protein